MIIFNRSEQLFWFSDRHLSSIIKANKFFKLRERLAKEAEIIDMVVI